VNPSKKTINTLIEKSKWNFFNIGDIILCFLENNKAGANIMPAIETSSHEPSSMKNIAPINHPIAHPPIVSPIIFLSSVIDETSIAAEVANPKNMPIINLLTKSSANVVS